MLSLDSFDKRIDVDLLNIKFHEIESIHVIKLGLRVHSKDSCNSWFSMLVHGIIV
ncbi:MAG: hypothetical protein ACTSVI_08525 [Promethearchaeota archaeon]